MVYSGYGTVAAMPVTDHLPQFQLLLMGQGSTLMAYCPGLFGGSQPFGGLSIPYVAVGVGFCERSGVYQLPPAKGTYQPCWQGYGCGNSVRGLGSRSHIPTSLDDLWVALCLCDYPQVCSKLDYENVLDVWRDCFCILE